MEFGGHPERSCCANTCRMQSTGAFGKERVVLTRRGEKHAGIVPHEDIEEEKKALTERSSSLS